MQRSTALKRLASILGKTAGYRINDKAPTPEERAAARLELPAAVAERDRLRAETDARREAVLKADAEYQELMAARQAAGKRVNELSEKTRHYRITVGKTVHDLFFSVMAEADTWEEIFEKLAKRRAA